MTFSLTEKLRVLRSRFLPAFDGLIGSVTLLALPAVTRTGLTSGLRALVRSPGVSAWAAFTIPGPGMVRVRISSGAS